jgi:protein-tyrosine phosphatase
MFSFFSKKKAPVSEGPLPDLSFLEGDMHSHLVPGIDDGSQSLEDSIRFVERLSALGLKHFITTPHIHGEMYDNDTAKVQHALQPLKQHLEQHMPDISFMASAEYFLDSYFLTEVLPAGLMAFGKNNVLVEVSMAGWPRNFNDLLFAIQANGYNPILAHPERYQYETNAAVYTKMKERGVLLQLNLLSVAGYYGKTVQSMAFELMDRQLYDFCGTDLHHERHLEKIELLLRTQPELVERLRAYGFRNRELYY